MLRRFLTLAVPLALACSGSEPEPPAPAEQAEPVQDDNTFPAFASETSTRVFQLYRMEAEYDLSPAELPPGVAGDGQFVMDHKERSNPKDTKRNMLVLEAPIPFPVSQQDQTFMPVGMEVEVNGKKVPYSRQPMAKANSMGWRLLKGNLLVTAETMPPPGGVRVIYPGVQQALDRHDPESSGLEVEEFVKYAVTLDGMTRHGLMLPAPASGQWKLQLPEQGATFESFLALEPGPLSSVISDGATAVLSVSDGGEPVEVSRKELSGPTKSFVQWRADLNEWKGKEVTLSIATEPGESSVLDWVFVGAPTVWGPAQGDTRRVVVIALDTTRPDRFGFNGYHRKTTPGIDALAEGGVIFDEAWAPAPRTRPSFRTATTGRRPLDAVGAKNIGEVFQDNGFATAGIVANVHLQPRFDFDKGFDSWFYEPDADAEYQVNRSLEWFEANLDRDTYLFVHFMDPHLPYRAPGKFEKRFLEDPDPKVKSGFTRSDVFQWDKRNTLTDRRKEHVQAMHDGELAYTSQEVTRFVTALDALPGQTVVVLHSDHGEEFWEHGGFEHNHTLYDEVTRVVFWMRPKGGLPSGRRIDVPVSLVDIAPTLFDLSGFDRLPELDGRSLVPLLSGDTTGDWDRPLDLGHVQYGSERWGVIWNGHKYIVHTGSGKQELYDLKNDPREADNLATKTDLTPYIEAMARAHDISVGHGWRVRVNLKDGADKPLTIRLPEPCLEANVLDPETYVEHRANQEWGEPPGRLASDIGRVTVSEDRRSLEFEPGPDPTGILYVRFAKSVSPADAGLLQDGQELALEPGRRGNRRWVQDDSSLILEAGTVVVPLPTEISRIRALRGDEAVDPNERELLQQLGYIGGDEGDG